MKWNPKFRRSKRSSHLSVHRRNFPEIDQILAPFGNELEGFTKISGDISVWTEETSHGMVNFNIIGWF